MSETNRYLTYGQQQMELARHKHEVENTLKLMRESGSTTYMTVRERHALKEKQGSCIN